MFDSRRIRANISLAFSLIEVGSVDSDLLRAGCLKGKCNASKKTEGLKVEFILCQCRLVIAYAS